MFDTDRRRFSSLTYLLHTIGSKTETVSQQYVENRTAGPDCKHNGLIISIHG